MANYTEKVTFLTIKEFKNKVGVETMDVLKNPNTGKLFLACDNGKNYKVQATINSQKDMKFLVPEAGDINEACLINVSEGAEKIFTL